jgi:hypothetical protein
MINDNNETLPKNSFNANRHCSHDRYNRFYKECGKGQGIPNILFYYLDRCVRHPGRDHDLVLVMEQKEIARTYEHDRS